VAQVVIQGEENLEHWQFAYKLGSKNFCRTCGVFVSNSFNDLTEERIAELPETYHDWARRAQPLHPVNVRVLDDVDLACLNVQRFDGKEIIKPGYVNP
jgi:hypothetical protein